MRLLMGRGRVWQQNPVHAFGENVPGTIFMRAECGAVVSAVQYRFGFGSSDRVTCEECRLKLQDLGKLKTNGKVRDQTRATLPFEIGSYVRVIGTGTITHKKHLGKIARVRNRTMHGGVILLFEDTGQILVVPTSEADNVLQPVESQTTGERHDEDPDRQADV